MWTESATLKHRGLEDQPGEEWPRDMTQELVGRKDPPRVEQEGPKELDQVRRSAQGLREQVEGERWIARTRLCLPSLTMVECLDGSSLKRKPKGFNQGSDSPRSDL